LVENNKRKGSPVRDEILVQEKNRNQFTTKRNMQCSFAISMVPR